MDFFLLLKIWEKNTGRKISKISIAKYSQKFLRHSNEFLEVHVKLQLVILLVTKLLIKLQKAQNFQNTKGKLEATQSDLETKQKTLAMKVEDQKKDTYLHKKSKRIII